MVIFMSYGNSLAWQARVGWHATRACQAVQGRRSWAIVGKKQQFAVFSTIVIAIVMAFIASGANVQYVGQAIWSLSVEKFDFSIQTRSGQHIVSVLIAGRDQEDAERKLRQMYRQCTVLQCNIRYTEDRLIHAASVEEILSLISR